MAVWYAKSISTTWWNDNTYSIWKFTARNASKTSNLKMAKDDVVVDCRNGIGYKVNKGFTITNSTSAYKYAFFKKESVYATKTPPTPTKMTSPTRSGDTWKASWTLPDDYTSSKSASRAEKTTSGWQYNGEGSWYSPASSNSTSSTYNISRASWYPVGKTKLTSITVRAYGSSAIGGDGKKTTAKTVIKTPRPPTIDDFAFDTSTGIVSTTVKTNAGTDLQERYDTRYTMVISDASGKTTTAHDRSSTDTSTALTWDATGYQGLSYSDYYYVVVKAWARGLAGDSGTAQKTLYISYPAQPTITAVDVSSTNPAGKVTVRINLNIRNDGQHPVTGAKLEYLANVPYENASDIPGVLPDGEEWTTTAQDNGQCTALASDVQSLTPAAGKKTWVRVKSWNLAEDTLYRYSTPVRVTDLETPAPTAEDEEVVILGAVDEDATSVTVQLAWNADGTDDADGTELSWADAENAWKSTEDPSTYRFSWSDGQVKGGGKTYRDSAIIAVKGLAEGVPAYIRARRYKEVDGKETFSPYSSTFMHMPASEADSLSLDVPEFLAEGTDLSVSWSYGSYASQTSWRLVTQYGRIIASGDGVATTAQVPWERVEAIASDGKLAMAVEVATGSELFGSDFETVNIVEPPSLDVAIDTMTAQPCAFTAVCNKAATLRWTLTAQGSGGDPALNMAAQLEGDVVASGTILPEWDKGESEVVMGGLLDLRDGGMYTLEVAAIDPVSGMEAIGTAEVAVDWEHKAPSIGDVEIEGVDETGEQDKHVQKAVITLAAPEGAAETDVYDIYRISGSRPVRVAEGVALDAVVTDRYAPYGSGAEAYRIAIRTADGDTNYLDVPYDLDGAALRFDWEGGSLELPYDIAITDGYSKDVEVRPHLDGSKDAFWNAATAHTASLSSTIVRLENLADVETARALGQWAGAVFVRTPDGSAYEADVQVTDLSTTGNIHAVSVSATEVNATAAFLAETGEAE